MFDDTCSTYSISKDKYNFDDINAVHIKAYATIFEARAAEILSAKVTVKKLERQKKEIEAEFEKLNKHGKLCGNGGGKKIKDKIVPLLLAEANSLLLDG